MFWSKANPEESSINITAEQLNSMTTHQINELELDEIEYIYSDKELLSKLSEEVRIDLYNHKKNLLKTIETESSDDIDSLINYIPADNVVIDVSWSSLNYYWVEEKRGSTESSLRWNNNTSVRWWKYLKILEKKAEKWRIIVKKWQFILQGSKIAYEIIDWVLYDLQDDDFDWKWQWTPIKNQIINYWEWSEWQKIKVNLDTSAIDYEWAIWEDGSILTREQIRELKEKKSYELKLGNNSIYSHVVNDWEQVIKWTFDDYLWKCLLYYDTYKGKTIVRWEIIDLTKQYSDTGRTENKSISRAIWKTLLTLWIVLWISWISYLAWKLDNDNYEIEPEKSWNTLWWTEKSYSSQEQVKKIDTGWKSVVFRWSTWWTLKWIWINTNDYVDMWSVQRELWIKDWDELFIRVIKGIWVEIEKKNWEKVFKGLKSHNFASE